MDIKYCIIAINYFLKCCITIIDYEIKFGITIINYKHKILHYNTSYFVKC
jgi:hypothetical protein